jgi:8-oxo-dGTP diphosphatase
VERKGCDVPEQEVTLVMGAAIFHGGRVLAARRTAPPAAAGSWELPGGKVEPGEAPDDAVAREIREELGCAIRVVGHLRGEQPAGPGYVLRVVRAELVEGEPVPHEHDAVRWLGSDQLHEVPWLESDVPFLDEIRALLEEPVWQTGETPVPDGPATADDGEWRHS